MLRFVIKRSNQAFELDICKLKPPKSAFKAKKMATKGDHFFRVFI